MANSNSFLEEHQRKLFEQCKEQSKIKPSYSSFNGSIILPSEADKAYREFRMDGHSMCRYEREQRFLAAQKESQGILNMLEQESKRRESFKVKKT